MTASASYSSSTASPATQLKPAGGAGPGGPAGALTEGVEPGSAGDRGRWVSTGTQKRASLGDCGLRTHYGP